MTRLSRSVNFPTVALGVLWIIHSLATTAYVPWQNQRQRAALEVHLEAIHAALRVQENLAAIPLAPAGHRASAEELREASRLQRVIADDIRAIREQTDDAESLALLKRIDDDAQSAAKQITASGNDSTGTEPPLLDVEDIHDRIADCNTLIRVRNQMLQDAVEERSRTDITVMVVRAWLLLLGLLVGIGLAMWIARGLARKISQISVTLKDAEGDLSAELGRIDVVPQQFSGDLGTLESQVEHVVLKLRHVAEELQQARQEMVRAARLAAVGELAAGVAHEIRNPLTSVKLLVQKAAERRPVHTLDDRQLQVLLEEISRIESTVQGLLDFARPEKPQRVRCSLVEIVHRTMQLVEGRLHQQGVQLEVDLDDRGEHIEADPRLLQQVLVNLVINALDAMPAGGRLQLSLHYDTDERTATIQLHDTGPGISPDVIDRLFEPFVTTRPNGSGLGLAISRRIVEEHGGRLHASNSQNGGAVLSVTLPFPPATAPAASLAETH